MSEFNLGESEHDFRVPDGGLHRPGAAGIWHATAALVVEVPSPDDETWQKLPFFAAHRVEEVLSSTPPDGPSPGLRSETANPRLSGEAD